MSDISSSFFLLAKVMHIDPERNK